MDKILKFIFSLIKVLLIVVVVNTERSIIAAWIRS